MNSTSPKPVRHLASKLRYSLLATYVSYGGLIGLFLFWNFSRSGGPNWVILALQTLPLLLLLPGMVKGYYRSFSWLCFVSLVYFVKAVDGVFLSTANGLDALFLALVVVLFIAAMLAARWLQRARAETQLV